MSERYASARFKLRSILLENPKDPETLEGKLRIQSINGPGIFFTRVNTILYMEYSTFNNIKNIKIFGEHQLEVYGIASIIDIEMYRRVRILQRDILRSISEVFGKGFKSKIEEAGNYHSLSKELSINPEEWGETPIPYHDNGCEIEPTVNLIPGENLTGHYLPPGASVFERNDQGDEQLYFEIISVRGGKNE